MYSLYKTPVGAGHFSGLQEAALELVEYGDFMCEHCAEVYPAIKLLQEKLGSSMRFVYRHYPLHAIHPLALEAAIATEAAALQGKFWYMHDMIYENQKHLLRSSFSRFAESINLDLNTFEDSRGHKQLLHKVINDYEKGVQCGVTGTPTFVINGKRYNGFDDFESLYRACRFSMDFRSSTGTGGKPALVR